MKIAWVYPHRERCGIALYAERYCEALNKRVETRTFDPVIHGNLNDLIVQVNRCDLVHVQYETSFFMRGRSDFYKRLVQSIKPPIIVTLHEVYREFPDVFPRENVRRSLFLLPLKRFLYDSRHPVQTAYRKHLADNFCCRTILVHQEYHKNILEEQHVPDELISVLPHPVNLVPDVPAYSWDGKRPVHLAASGYINPHYNYDLLFAALKKLDFQWRFTWIGGVRRDEDKMLLNDILHRVSLNKWEDRFRITGWMPEEEHNKVLCTADVICALFSSRSSSGTLASAIGAGRPIIATPLPLTEELASNHGVVHLVEASADIVARGIEEVLTNKEIRGFLEKSIMKYRALYNYDAMAERLVEVYRKYG